VAGECQAVVLRTEDMAAERPCRSILRSCRLVATAGTMIPSSPRFRIAGVATYSEAVTCTESGTPRISARLLPVVIG